MKRVFALVILAAAVWLPALGAPDITSSYRLYKLCEIQDPQCLPALRGLVKKIVADNPGCAQYPVPDQALYATFMQVVGNEPSLLRYPPLTVEAYVYSSTIAGCIHKMPAPQAGG